MKSSFGADDAQVERDYLISHSLAAISAHLGNRIKFFGGTALSRTHLPSGRLSEDIDLISVGGKSDVVDALAQTLTHELAREFGRPSFSPELSTLVGSNSTNVKFPSGHEFNLQLLPEDHYPTWPFEMVELEQRYGNVGPATLSVPTLAAFAAWKSIAYLDRRAPRDLWDLAAMAEIGAFTLDAARLFTKFGPFQSLPTDSTIPAAPDEATWQRELSHQTRLSLTAQEARKMLVESWARLK